MGELVLFVSVCSTTDAAGEESKDFAAVTDLAIAADLIDQKYDLTAALVAPSPGCNRDAKEKVLRAVAQTGELAWPQNDEESRAACLALIELNILREHRDEARQYLAVIPHTRQMKHCLELEYATS